MSAIDRVAPTIEFTSPDGAQFSAYWVGNTVSNSKNLGVFDFPLVDGQLIQDLGLSSNTWPLTIYFEGQNHDIEAKNFRTAFKSREAWSVIHPVDGSLTLQPVSISVNINPVENANITVIETEWIEPVDDQTVQSVPEIENNIQAEKVNIEEAASVSFARNATQEATAEKIEIEKATETGLNTIENNLKALYDQAADIAADVGSTFTAIRDTINQTVIDTTTLAGQIQNAVQLPALAVNDFTSRIEGYTAALVGFLSGAPESTLPEDRSSIGVTEQYVSAVLAAVGTIATTSEFITTSEVLNAIQEVNNFFETAINGLEALQENFNNLPLDRQYFSLLDTYGNLENYRAQIIAFLLRTALNLKIEKRFILSQSRAPIEIALTEYGGPGENDSNIDLFILSNSLKGDDILLLPPGREVVVYV